MIKKVRTHKIRFYPSTQLCPVCSTKNKIPLSERIYRCSCGYGPIDRDLHAACNILRAGCPDVKPVEIMLDPCLRARAVVNEAGSTQKQVTGAFVTRYSFYKLDKPGCHHD